MVYPPSPWTLQGYALQTVQLIDVTRVRSLILSEFNILDYNRQKLGLQLPFIGDVFSPLSASILLFKGEFNSRIGIVGSQLQVPPESSLARLDLEQPWLTIHCEPLRLVTGTPKIVGHRVEEFSYQ